jgi:two-component system chemotaxis response regulator CheY
MAKTALIVDDSPLMRKIIKKNLSKIVDNWSFFEACDGADGLDKVRDNSIDIIFSDINMPVMNGLEFISHLRRNSESRNIPVVVITSEGNEEFIDLSARLGAAGYIRKPFTPQKFRLLLDAIDLE